MSPVAGRILPKTRSSGIFSTKRRSAVRVRRFTRMLVPKPKKAFQSPGTHSLGLKAVFMVVFRVGIEGTKGRKTGDKAGCCSPLGKATPGGTGVRDATKQQP